MPNLHETEIEYEVWQDDECLAITSSWDAEAGTDDAALRDAMHYATVYRDRGEVKVWRVTKVRELIVVEGQSK